MKEQKVKSRMSIYDVAQALPSQAMVCSKERISINIDLENDQLRIYRKHFPVKYLKPGTISDFNKRFISSLEKIKLKIPNANLEIKPLSDNDFLTCINELREIGSEAYALLPPDVQTYLQDLDSKASEDGKGLRLDFMFPSDQSLFWEMLYSGNSDDDQTDLTKFWGFRYPIGYLDLNCDIENRIHLRGGIFASSHENLDHTNEEIWRIRQIIKEFGKNIPKANLQLTQLNQVLTENSEKKFLELLRDDFFLYGIVHFACHCVNPKESTSVDSYLQFTSNKQKIVLKLGNLLVKRKQGFRHKPLVFLNACETTTPMHFLDAINFPSVLLEFGAGAVIATACSIPDNFALAFATKFYRNLFDRSLKESPAIFSEILLETRLEFLKDFRNPLGLAYGLRADTKQWLKIFD